MHEPTRIVAVRHGETDWNVDTRLQGQRDVGLNAHGRWQASRLADALAHDGIAAVYASDLARAWDSATALAGPLGLPVRAEAGLRERCFGLFEGSTYAEIETRWPDAAARWRRREPGFAPAGGETLEAFSARSLATVLALAQGHAGQAIAIVTHGGVLDCLYRAATHLPPQAPRSWPLPNAGVNRLLATGQGLALVGWGDTAHLQATPETTLPSREDGSV